MKFGITLTVIVLSVISGKIMKSLQSAVKMCPLVISAILLLLSIGLLNASPATTTSPKGHHKHSHHHHQEWDRTEIMDANGLFILEWNVVEAKEIVFKITANTGGFIGLGFSYKTGKMANADLVLAWVDDHTGKPNVLVIIIIIVWSLCVLYLCENCQQKELLAFVGWFVIWTFKGNSL